MTPTMQPPAPSPVATPAADTTSATTPIQHTWREHEQPFTAVVAQVRDWDAASPCEGWSARDVLAHVIDTQREFLAKHGHALPGPSASQGGAGAGTQPAASTPSAHDPTQQWRTHAAAVDRLLADESVAGQRFDGFFGPTTIGETMARFYGFDLLVHRWDIGTSQGDEVGFSDEELTAIDTAVDGFGEHAYAPGIFGTPVEVGGDGTRQARVLGRTGRTVRTGDRAS